MLLQKGGNRAIHKFARQLREHPVRFARQHGCRATRQVIGNVAPREWKRLLRPRPRLANKVLNVVPRRNSAANTQMKPPPPLWLYYSIDGIQYLNQFPSPLWW